MIGTVASRAVSRSQRRGGSKVYGWPIMITHSRILRGVASIAFGVVTCAGLVSCGGDFSNPVAPTSPLQPTAAAVQGNTVREPDESDPDPNPDRDPDPNSNPNPNPDRDPDPDPDPDSDPSNPDLMVVVLSVDDSSPATGASLTLSAILWNAGDGESPATTLRYYRSTDATITTGDTPVGTDAVGALAADDDGDESISLTAPATAGTYYYGACVDAVAGESDTTNNCSESVRVRVGVEVGRLRRTWLCWGQV